MCVQNVVKSKMVIQGRFVVVFEILIYEGCSNMNASSFIAFLTYMIRQNGKRFNKGLYVTFKLAPD